MRASRRPDIRNQGLLWFSLLVAAVHGFAPSASACGGFFCNAVDPVPILQAGERVLFAQEGDTTIMHVEVAWEGPSTSFGWLLPLAALPLGPDGKPVPLDETLRLSHASIFDTLQTRTAPSYRVQNTFADGGCNMFPGGGSADSASFGDSTSSGPFEPPVAVLQEAAVGPYTAQILEATDADALFAWLNDNGYTQDEKARPLLAEYVAKGYVFLGLRLQNNKTTGDLRPVQLRLTEDAPCVPLKLTSIAAVQDMPILVFVLGPARAIPKNNFHAVVNPKALSWPGAGNYQQIIAEAVDPVQGHAFITEYSGSTGEFSSTFSTTQQSAATALRAATTMADVLSGYDYLGLPKDETYAAIVQDEVLMPAGLKGYPYGDCYYGGGGGWDPWLDASDLSCPPNEEHVTTEAEFYNYLDWWVTSGGVSLDAHALALRDRLIAEIVVPLAEVQTTFDKAPKLTRFLTILDPEEMTRDPIFAFNSELPDVTRDNVLRTVIHQTSCDDGYIEATYPDGTVHILECGGFCGSQATLPPVPGEAALKYVEVIDESGAPLPVAPDQYGAVDGYLSMAVAGSPTIPQGVDVTPPAPGPVVTGNTEGRPVTSIPGGSESGNGASGATESSNGGTGGCGASSSASGAFWLWLGLLGAFAVRRARLRAPPS
ncbi:MAG: DUF2330 domain-containing protein [Myxococcales bacterium]|nr:DUF2330 domain-containing protein [Myxococcales bacterium]